MRFHLEMNCDNAAFDDQPATEIARILREVADRVEHGDLPPRDGLKVRDANGNTVGHWTIEE